MRAGTEQARLNKLRAMFARAANTSSNQEADTAARMAREWMRRYGFTEADVKGWRTHGTEAEYILQNFRAAQARWREMDREQAKGKAKKAKTGKARKTAKAKAKAKAESTEHSYRLVTVAGHWRVSKLGKRYWVNEHTRRIKVKAA